MKLAPRVKSVTSYKKCEPLYMPQSTRVLKYVVFCQKDRRYDEKAVLCAVVFLFFFWGGGRHTTDKLCCVLLKRRVSKMCNDIECGEEERFVVFRNTDYLGVCMDKIPQKEIDNVKMSRGTPLKSSFEAIPCRPSLDPTRREAMSQWPTARNRGKFVQIHTLKH